MYALAALAALSFSAGADAPEKVKKLFGEKAVAVLAGATKVEVFRVDSGKPGGKDKTVGGYRVTATGKDRDEKFAARLAGVVLDEESYVWGAAKGCVFQPGVAFRVWKGEESVEVVICFACDQVRVSAAGKDGVPAESDPGRAALVKLAKEALPDDKEIQKLTESR